MYKLAIVTSHPIQYQAPWFRALARVTDLTVFFCHKQEPTDHARTDFGVPFEWDIPLLDGYIHQWLNNVATQPDVSTFRGCDTPEIADILVSDAFDACIVSGWYLKSYLQAIRACRRAGIPVLVRGDSQLATRRSRLVNAVKYFPYRWLLQRIDGHLYVGQSNLDYLRHYGVAEPNLFFVPHSVDNAFFTSGAIAARATGAAAEVRREAGAGPHSTVFIFIGKLIDKKRPADFLLAVEKAKGRGADVRGIVVGSGPLGAELQSLARARAIPVWFAGFRNQTELPRYFAAADALVLPSDEGETWGLVVNEAMACGLPAIVSRAAGCARDLIDEGCTGYAYDRGAIDQLSDALLKFHAHGPDDRSAFRDAVAAKIDQYSTAAAVRETLSAITVTVERCDTLKQRQSPFDQATSRRGSL